MSPFIPVFLGSCNSSHMQGMLLQVLVFFRTDSAPWQDLAPGRHGKKTPVQLELLCVPAFLQRGENLSLLRAFMEKKNNNNNISLSQKDVFLAETYVALS